jgi:integrase
MANTGRKRRAKGSGKCRQLPSGRWQAQILGSDGQYHPAPQTFDTRLDADAWLAAQGRDLQIGTWVPPDRRAAPNTLADYSQHWIATRTVRRNTLAEYQRDLDNRILPELGDILVDRLTPKIVNRWYANQGDSAPSARAHAYDTLRNMLNTAVDEELISANPCRIRGASKTKSPRKIKPATLDEIAIMHDHLPERYRAMFFIAVWCVARFGEVTELRRSDVDLESAVLNISRGVVKIKGEFIVGQPKSDAGIRSVDIPPHIVGAIQSHLDTYVGPTPDALLFPSATDARRHLSQSTHTRVWYPAREAAGRPDLHWHDLRHTGATMAAATGATLADLMHRLGHSTVAAAMIYQHAVDGKGKQIAERLSEMALSES